MCLVSCNEVVAPADERRCERGADDDIPQLFPELDIDGRDWLACPRRFVDRDADEEAEDTCPVV